MPTPEMSIFTQPSMSPTSGMWLSLRKQLRPDEVRLAIPDLPRVIFPAAPAAPTPAPAPSQAANGGDPILTTLIDAIKAPPSTQLPAQYSGGRVYVQSGSAGNPAALWVVLAVVAGAGVWWFKSRGGK